MFAQNMPWMSAGRHDIACAIVAGSPAWSRPIRAQKNNNIRVDVSKPRTKRQQKHRRTDVVRAEEQLRDGEALAAHVQDLRVVDGRLARRAHAAATLRGEVREDIFLHYGVVCEVYTVSRGASAYT